MPCESPQNLRMKLRQLKMTLVIHRHAKTLYASTLHLAAATNVCVCVFVTLKIVPVSPPSTSMRPYCSNRHGQFPWSQGNLPPKTGILKK